MKEPKYFRVNGLVLENNEANRLCLLLGKHRYMSDYFTGIVEETKSEGFVNAAAIFHKSLIDAFSLIPEIEKRLQELAFIPDDKIMQSLYGNFDVEVSDDKVNWRNIYETYNL